MSHELHFVWTQVLRIVKNSELEKINEMWLLFKDELK